MLFILTGSKLVRCRQVHTFQTRIFPNVSHRDVVCFDVATVATTISTFWLSLCNPINEPPQRKVSQLQLWNFTFVIVVWHSSMDTSLADININPSYTWMHRRAAHWAVIVLTYDFQSGKIRQLFWGEKKSFLSKLPTKIVFWIHLRGEIGLAAGF